MKKQLEMKEVLHLFWQLDTILQATIVFEPQEILV